VRGGAPFPKSVTTQTDRRPLLLQADRLQRQLNLLRRYLSLPKLQPRFLHALLARSQLLIDQIVTLRPEL
jgi:hypothetical protein